MLKNYLKIALRNIRNKKFYSLLNLLGLSIGITAGVLIIIYVQDELSYDQFHPNAENKYVAGLDGKMGNQEIMGIHTPPVMAGIILEETPGIQSVTKTYNAGDIVFRKDDQVFTEKSVYWADSTFFDFFGFELMQGDRETVLDSPNKVVLTESAATKYFGSENPIGQTISVGNDQSSYEVTGLTADPPHNTHFEFDILLSFSSIDYSRSTQWLSNSINTYLEVNPNVSISEIEESFDELVTKYVGPQMEQFMGATIEQMEAQGNQYGYFAFPILDLHLHASGMVSAFKAPSDITYVYIFSVIGFFLILIACVNFMNLYTASASGRAKEVGLRKTLGAERNSMMTQFLFESILYVLLAAILSVFLIYLILPWFNSLSGKMLTLQIFTEPWFLGTMSGLIIIIGLIAGSYPAFYLTSFSPVDVLKGRVRRGAQSSGFRSTLVVGQFFISIGLIACTILVNQQLQFMQNKNLGFNKEQSIVLTNTSRLDNNREPFKEELLSDTRVLAASYTTFTIPGTQNVTVFQRPETDSDYIMAMYYADHDHWEALGFEMAEGRYFSENFPTDSSAIVINQTAVQELGLDEPVGQEIIFPGNDNRVYDVIGVMKDFNFQSLRDEIMPLAIVLTETANEMIVRFQSEDPRDAVNMITSTWDEYSAGEPVDYTFLDDDFDELFREEQRLGAVFTAFTIIAIFIACLGLLGLSAYMAERRTQEIGIRKVMGATVPNILGLLSVEFLKLIGIAFLLAIPISWYFIQNWLQGFAYRTEISPMIFVFTALATIGIVLVTISWQTLKAAFMNPVRSIKTE